MPRKGHFLTKAQKKNLIHNPEISADRDIQRLIDDRHLKSIDRLKFHIPTLENAFWHIGYGSDGNAKDYAYAVARKEAARDPRFNAYVDLWERMSEEQREKATIDELVWKAGLPEEDFIAAAARVSWRHGVDTTRMMLAAKAPEVAAATIAAALEANGFKDRQMIMQSLNVAPSSKGITINNQQNNNQENVVKHEGLPEFSQDVIELVHAVRLEDE